MWSDRTPSPSLGPQLRAAVASRATLKSLMWLASGPQGPCLLEDALATIAYAHGHAVITTATTRLELRVSAFDLLEAAMEVWRDIPGAMLAGYFAYDLAAELEDLGALPADDTGVPQMFLGLYDSSASGPMHAAPVAFTAGPLSSRPDSAGFQAAVERTVGTIHAGDIFQTNLCRRLEGAFSHEGAEPLFARLCEVNPARYAAFVRIDDQRAVLSMSPELYLKVRDGIVESAPIKGTRPRGALPELDRALAEGLLASKKDRAELAMIVDVVRNDLGRVAKTGSVTVTEHAQLMTLPTVHHSYSTVRAQLREDATSVDLLRASFPPASISGAPKIEAMRVAMREEQQLRGPAMGAIGWISLSGDMELSVAIRTAWIADNKIRYYAGCGITADSVPSEEYEESEHKVAAFRRALGV